MIGNCKMAETKETPAKKPKEEKIKPKKPGR